MKQITTETGSVYQIDEVNRKWRRVSSTDQSGEVRDGEQGGDLRNVNPINFEIGKSIVIASTPISPTDEVSVRLICTSHVTKIEDINGNL